MWRDLILFWLFLAASSIAINMDNIARSLSILASPPGA